MTTPSSFAAALGAVFGVPDESPTWTPEDNEQAAAEGWAIFVVDGRDPATEAQLVDGEPYGHRPYELQKVDESDTFDDDNEAWTYVLRRSQEGDDLATRALRFLEVESPNEYREIVRCGGAT